MRKPFEIVRTPQQEAFPTLRTGRVLVWISCGAASACAGKMTLQQFPDAELLYCNTLPFEHPDNPRFLGDIEKWTGKQVKILQSKKYTDIFDVWRKRNFLLSAPPARMAICTIELKRAVREVYQSFGDVHVFGFGVDELARINRFERDNPEISLTWPLRDAGMNKQDCLNMLMQAGIELPAMYKLGYKNNNCIGCVKGGKGYWNKIRVDFPDYFWNMARFEREINARVFNDVWLDELSPTAGRYESEYEIECGPVCGTTGGQS